jgi:hypothetical protein
VLALERRKCARVQLSAKQCGQLDYEVSHERRQRDLPICAQRLANWTRRAQRLAAALSS